MRKIGIAVLLTSLIGSVGGCAVDLASTNPDKSESGNQLRYYGGPKSPMWASQ